MPTFLDRIRAFAAPASLPQPGAGEGAPVAYIDPFRLWAPKTRVYNPSLIVGRKGLVIYDEMRRDDQVKAALEFKKRSALSTTWQVHPADPEAKEDEVADFVKTQFEDMAGSFNTSLWEVMTALDYGYSVTEKVFESDGDTINLKKLSTVQPRSITFEQGRDGEITAMYQANNETVLDPAKFLIYSYQARFANAYGTSDLEAAYRPWWAKDNAYRWLCMMLERFGIPPVAAIYNPSAYNPAQLSELQGALSSLQANSYMTIPRGKPDDLEMWTPELAGQIQRAFIPAMDMFNGDIARSMLMPGLMGMTTDNQSTGSLARAQVHFDAFMLVVESIQDDIASILNDQLIPQLVDLNFPNVDGYPRFEFDPFTDDVRLDILTTWAGLVTQHAVTSGPQDEVHIRSLLKFPEREEVQQPVNEPTLVAPDDPSAPPLPGTPPPQTPPAGPMPLPEVPPKLPLPVRGDAKQANQSQQVIRLVSDDGSMSRVANQVEIDAGIDRFATMADALDKAGLARMHTVLSDMEQKTLARLQATGGDFTSEGIDQFDVAGRDALNGVTLLVLQDAYRAGRVSIRTQFNTVKTFATDPNLIPEAALNYLDAKAFQVSNVVSDRLQGQIKQTLLSGLKAGWTLDKTTSAIRDIFAPYTATESSVLVDSPWQLETIVRTNNTDALNQGRLIEARALGDFVTGYLFSAIIDSRTTECCSFLDEKWFPADSDAADLLAPPRHFNCRSILIPTSIDQVTAQFTAITDADVLKAETLSGQGF